MNIRRYMYLYNKLNSIIMDDLMMEVEFIHDIISNKIRRIIV